MKYLSVILLLFLSSIACTPEKSPIEYGFDKCYYCKMTIVDKKFGSEVVTRKGKVYKFDATECMINFLSSGEVELKDVAYKLTNTFDNPGELMHVDHCYFLQSENMPSPMGMFVNPFSEKNLALEYQTEQNGTIYQWHEIKEKIPSGY